MMNSTEPARRSWTGIALPVSLLLNAFLIALTVGHYLHRGTAPSTPVLARALANAEASLPRADAAAFRDVMTQDATRYTPAAHELAAARAALEQQIAAEPYDPEAVRRALVSWQASWNRLLDQLQTPLVDALGRVSPEGRRKLIEERRKELAADHEP